ncbi:MAG: sulfotransferase [Cyanobacteria bacterium P01_D01_bin.1]
MLNLPNFLIIGAAKAGTTSLCHYLTQHPEIYISEEKEPRFFSPEFYTKDTNGLLRNNARKEAFSLEEYQNLFESVTIERAIGEATTEYLYYPKTPQRIRDRIPNARLIAILRNPVERAFSAYCYQLRDGCETVSFEEAIVQSPIRASSNWRPGWLYTQSGYYYEQLKRYYDLFPKEQIQIHLFSDFMQAPNAVCQKIFEFLEVKSSFEVPDLSAKNVSMVPKNQFVGDLIKKGKEIKEIVTDVLPEAIIEPVVQEIKSYLYEPKPELSDDVRQVLIELYKEDVIALESLINRDLSAWLS